LNVVSLHLPPLRERPEDSRSSSNTSSPQGAADRHPEKRLNSEAVDALLRYPWPGNVREIENVIERVLVLSDHDPIEVDDLPEYVRVGGWSLPRSSSRCYAARRH